MRLAALLLLTMVSCSTTADDPDTEQEQQAAQCTASSSCTEATGGKCMTISSKVHMCAYPDATCMSGYRYDEVSGSQFSKACTPAQQTPSDPQDPPQGW